MSVIISDPVRFRLTWISFEVVALPINKRIHSFDHFFNYSKMEKKCILSLLLVSFFYNNFSGTMYRTNQTDQRNSCYIPIILLATCKHIKLIKLN